MATVTECSSVEQYVKTIGPHHQHPTERADQPFQRLMGRRCKQCDIEARISIADFRNTGDVPVYEKLMEEFGGVKKK